jgi:hypothetical protein
MSDDLRVGLECPPSMPIETRSESPRTTLAPIANSFSRSRLDEKIRAPPVTPTVAHRPGGVVAARARDVVVAMRTRIDARSRRVQRAGRRHAKRGWGIDDTSHDGVGSPGRGLLRGRFLCTIP